MESKIIYDSSIDQGLIKSMKVAVIGFGSQGHAHSLNLHESGVDITVGLREDSESFKRAQDMGLQVANLEDATKNADVVMLLLPDQIMADVYNDQIASHIKEGATLLFAHGFNIHFNEIVPREDLSVAMVAPKGPGHLLRRTYSEGSGMPCLVAVHKDASGTTENLAMSYASAIGGGRAGILRTTFKDGLPSISSLLQLLIYPSVTKTLTSSCFNFEYGTSTSTLPRIKPLRILVKQSAIGS